MDDKYFALLAQTPPVPPGRLGKEGAVRSEMQITLDWVSPSQTSPRRMHSQPRLSRSSAMIWEGMHHQHKGKGWLWFSVLSIAVCVISYSTHMASSLYPPIAENKAWNASVRQDCPLERADIAYWHRPTLGSWNTPAQPEVDDIRPWKTNSRNLTKS